MTEKYDVIIIGAGAAGLMSAIEAGKRGRKVLLVDHAKKIGEKIRISDRVCFFNEGKIFEQGPPEQLFGNPQNEITKQFLHAVLDAN